MFLYQESHELLGRNFTGRVPFMLPKQRRQSTEGFSELFMLQDITEHRVVLDHRYLSSDLSVSSLS